MFISFEKQQQQPEEMKKLQETLEIICVALRSSIGLFNSIFSTHSSEDDDITKSYYKMICSYIPLTIYRLNIEIKLMHALDYESSSNIKLRNTFSLKFKNQKNQLDKINSKYYFTNRQHQSCKPVNANRGIVCIYLSKLYFSP